jgi:quinate dehydrogenase (quinone)
VTDNASTELNAGTFVVVAKAVVVVVAGDVVANTREFKEVAVVQVPCNQPPYGVLAAIDLEQRTLLWERPIGSAKDSGPLGMKTRLPVSVGTPQSGGTMTTAGGLIFSAGTFDNTIRATDISNGMELWSDALPFTAHATPMSYLSPAGKQTVVITVPVFNSTSASGFRVLPADQEDPEGGYIIAYRLPD